MSCIYKAYTFQPQNLTTKHKSIHSVPIIIYRPRAFNIHVRFIKQHINKYIIPFHPRAGPTTGPTSCATPGPWSRSLRLLATLGSAWRRSGFPRDGSDLAWLDPCLCLVLTPVLDLSWPQSILHPGWWFAWPVFWRGIDVALHVGCRAASWRLWWFTVSLVISLTLSIGNAFSSFFSTHFSNAVSSFLSHVISITLYKSVPSTISGSISCTVNEKIFYIVKKIPFINW